MKLKFIITLANAAVAHRFVAMERSLRAVGCSLPLLVIPYNDEQFTLPANASWWEHAELFSWLDRHRAHPMMRKYQCLLTSHYQFVDSDVIFLHNPEDVLQTHSGFVTCCQHWKNTDHAFTPELQRLLQERYPEPELRAFNAGQFACDSTLYSFTELQRKAEAYRDIVLTFPFHDQPGYNLLVGMHDISYTNLTLAPYHFYSSWAGDYLLAHEPFWQNTRAPYLLHWAGVPMLGDEHIQKLWKQYLSKDEYEHFVQAEQKLQKKKPGRWRRLINKFFVK